MLHGYDKFGLKVFIHFVATMGPFAVVMFKAFHCKVLIKSHANLSLANVCAELRYAVTVKQDSP